METQVYSVDASKLPYSGLPGMYSVKAASQWQATMALYNFSQVENLDAVRCEDCDQLITHLEDAHLEAIDAPDTYLIAICTACHESARGSSEPTEKRQSDLAHVVDTLREDQKSITVSPAIEYYPMLAARVHPVSFTSSLRDYRCDNDSAHTLARNPAAIPMGTPHVMLSVWLANPNCAVTDDPDAPDDPTSYLHFPYSHYCLPCARAHGLIPS